MQRMFRWLAASVLLAGGLLAQQQPAGAVAAAAMIGGGSMTDAEGPLIGGMTAVTGTISGTAVGTFGTCTFSSPLYGAESIIQGQGYSPTFTCLPCQMWYQRVGHEIVMNGSCSWPYGSFQLAGFAEPTSALPTNSYLYQVAGPTSPAGVLAIQGNITFTPGSPLGLDTGDLLQVPTGVDFHGTLTGLLGNTVGSCGFDFVGGGYEGVLLGQSNLTGDCTGPGVYTTCNISWARVATHTFITGNCSGSIGFSLFGTGEMVLSGGGFTFVGEVNVL